MHEIRKTKSYTIAPQTAIWYKAKTNWNKIKICIIKFKKYIDQN